MGAGSVGFALSLLVASAQVLQAQSKPGPPTRDQAMIWARQLLAAFPKAPAGWRVGAGALFGDQIAAPDQGAGQRWRYLPTAVRVYLHGNGAMQRQLRLRAILAPAGWVSEKRRQMSKLTSRVPHCVSKPEPSGQEAWLLGWFDAAARHRQPKGDTCIPGARLVVLSGRVILTLSTAHNVGAAGLKVAQSVGYKQLKGMPARLANGDKE